jgi:DNA-binding winged helix-turn-helix (wHTH) protein/tetratricopeptide (TPR) repeat protein
MVRPEKAPSSCDLPYGAIVFGNLRLEIDGSLQRGDTTIHLPPKELAALRLLLQHTGHIVTHHQIQHALWGDVHVTADSVPKCMSSLRERLRPDDECIQTVYKRGYRLTVTVRSVERTSEDALPRVAIMPFEAGFNVAPHLGSAIADETVALLTREQLAPAHVLARDSVFTLAARGYTAQQVGEALHADLVLTGTVRALPDHFRLRAEMIRVADDTQMWVEDLLVARSRAAGLESELAQRLLVRLNGGGLALSIASAEDADNDQSNRREAYDLFLRGHHEWQTLQRHRMQDGLRHLFRAVELDPSLVPAQVDLANACIAQELFGFMSPTLAAEQVRLAAQAIPPSRQGSEAILPALGWVRFHVDHDLAGALRAFRTSAHLPHDTAITRVRSMFALSRHQFGEAIEMLSAALQADPFSPWLHARLAWAHHLAGDSARSLAQIERALELFPEYESSSLYGAIILAFNGEAERAISLAENLVRKSPYFDLAMAVHGYALACIGRCDEARTILERLQWLSRERFVMNSFTTALFVALGDLDGALAEMHAAAEARCPWFFQMLADPRMKALHERSEFAQMQRVLDRMEASAEKHAGNEG